MQVSGLTEIIPFICISAAWGQHAVICLFTSFFLAHCREWQHLVGYQALFCLGSEIHIWRAGIPDGCNTLV